MQVSHTSKYHTVLEIAERAGATSVSFQYHVFVNFASLAAAERFTKAALTNGLKPWEINTERPGVPFEVIVERWK